MSAPAVIQWSGPICVQGLDLSYTATGMVTVRDQRKFVETIHTTPAMGPDVRRRRHIARRVTETLSDVRPALVVVEDAIAFMGKGSTTMQLCTLHGVVRDWLWRPGVVVAEVHPSTLKMYATGNGRAKKEQVLEAARLELVRTFGVANDDNQADAMWLACMGLHHIGRCPVQSTRARATAMLNLDWPVIERAPAGGWRDGVRRIVQSGASLRESM